jgi:serine/threonine protein kinase
MNVSTSMGRVLGDRYQVGELLGSGGMASVWRGRDLRLDRPVAIKELAGAWLGDPAAVRRFDREARTAARLAHPNIIAVYDVGVHEHTPYLVTELIEGITVSALLTEGPLPVAVVVAIAAQACEGLGAAHKAGVIHRDIKPANLMLTHNGVLKICDFGIAKALFTAADTGLSGPMCAWGTSSYMAPEQAHGEQVDARTDLYALGCTMYAMLAGVPPFIGNVQDVLQQHLNRAAVPLRAHRADIPAALEALAMWLLSKDPDDRPGSAEEVRASLVDAMGEPTQAVIAVSGGAMLAIPPSAVPSAVRPPPRSEPAEYGRASRKARSKWYWLVAIAALIAVLTTVAALWRISSGGLPQSTDSAVLAPLSPPSMTMTTSAPPQLQPSGSGHPPKPAQAVQAPASQPSTASSQPPPADPIATLRLAIQQQVNTGNLNPDKASDLYTKVDAIAHAAHAGNTNDEANKIKELRDSLTGLRTGGQLSTSGYDVLSKDLDAIAATFA